MYLKRPAGGLAFCLFYLASCFTNKVRCSGGEPREAGAAVAEAGAPGHVAAACGLRSGTGQPRRGWRGLGAQLTAPFASQNGWRGVIAPGIRDKWSEWCSSRPPLASVRARGV